MATCEEELFALAHIVRGLTPRLLSAHPGNVKCGSEEGGFPHGSEEAERQRQRKRHLDLNSPSGACARCPSFFPLGLNS